MRLERHNEGAVKGRFLSIKIDCLVTSYIHTYIPSNINNNNDNSTLAAPKLSTEEPQDYGLRLFDDLPSFQESDLGQTKAATKVRDSMHRFYTFSVLDHTSLSLHCELIWQVSQGSQKPRKALTKEEREAARQEKLKEKQHRQEEKEQRAALRKQKAMEKEAEKAKRKEERYVRKATKPGECLKVGGGCGGSVRW